MKTSQGILLKLIRISLWGPECASLTTKPDWNKVLILAKQQTVLGLVAEAVPHLEEKYRPAPQTAAKLYSIALNICRTHSLLNRKVADLKSRLDANGIRSILFKGQGVAINYPNPLSRQCGDIDMYVGEKHFQKALELLKPNCKGTALDYKWTKHFNLTEEGVDIEIHRIAEIIPGYRKDRLFQEWTEFHLGGDHPHTVELAGTSINLPPHQFNAIYIMNHAWHHFLNGGIGLRQLCDWTMFLHRHHQDIDHDILRNDLKRFGLYRAWLILAGVAVNSLGLPAEECPLYTGEMRDKSSMMLDVIWSEGNFGFFSDSRKKVRPDGHFAGKFHSFILTTSRIKKVLLISPSDILKSWISYFINGMRNLFVKVK